MLTHESRPLRSWQVFDVRRKMRIAVALLFVGVAGCSTSHRHAGGDMLMYSERTLADWNPDRAPIEAQRDLAAGTPKIYLSGTMVAFPPGIDPADYPLVKSLPKADAGIGCLIPDGTFRSTQFEYASRYNAAIVSQLKAKANQSIQTNARERA